MQIFKVSCEWQLLNDVQFLFMNRYLSKVEFVFFLFLILFHLQVLASLIVFIHKFSRDLWKATESVFNVLDVACYFFKDTFFFIQIVVPYSMSNIFQYFSRWILVCVLRTVWGQYSWHSGKLSRYCERENWKRTRNTNNFKKIERTMFSKC